MRRAHLRLILALAVALVAAAGASPAPAGSHDSAPTVGGAEVFDGLAALTEPSAARRLGSTPRTEKNTRKYDGGSDGQKTPGKPTAGTIPVYFHVVYASDGTGGPETVTPQVVDEQIAVLNMTFSGFRGGADTGFRFTLADLDYTENDAWFEQATFEDELSMKETLKQGGPTDLNVYTTSGGGFLGWAYFPKITNSNQFEALDGIVLHYGSLPGGFIPDFNLGFTATHEVGHYLGLEHTFYDAVKGCIGHGDFVDDTPFMVEPTSGCPPGKDSCPRKPGLDPIHNYMDYSDDVCYTEFTPGQTERMQKQYAHWRSKRA